LKAGKIELQEEPIALGALVQSAVAAIRAIAEKNR
jgi:hypothetical protein